MKEKVNEGRRYLKFQVGDLVLMHLNKSRLQKGMSSKLQMRRIGPYRILEKYGQNAYKLDLPKELGSPIFNVKDLFAYKGPEIPEDTQKEQMERDVHEIKIRA